MIRLWLNFQYWKNRFALFKSKYKNLTLVPVDNSYIKVCNRFTCRFTKGVCVQKTVCNLHKGANWEDEQYYYTDCNACSKYQITCVGRWILTHNEKVAAYRKVTGR